MSYQAVSAQPGDKLLAYEYSSMKVFDGLYAFLWQDYQENNCNTYLIDGTTKVLIDPGHRHLFPKVRGELGERGIIPTMINVVAITHGHRDHCGAAGECCPPALLAMNHEEYRFSQKRFGSELNIPYPDYSLAEGVFTTGEHQFQVISTPGHSPASICLYWPLKKALFAGDVVFHDSIGRFDLPGGNGKLLKESILKIESLDVEYLLPGHGELIVEKEDVQENFQHIRDYWFAYL